MKSIEKTNWTNEKDLSQKKYAFIVIIIASFLPSFMGSAINIATHDIGKELNTSTFALSWVVNSFLLASATFLVPFGKIADMVGRKRICVLGIAVFSIASLLSGIAWSADVLIIFRVFQGLGSAMINATNFAIIASVFSPHERGKMLGINGAAIYTALSLGPSLGGILNHQLGWRSIFYFNTLLGIIALVLAVMKVNKEWTGTKGEKFDFIGAILYMMGLATFIFGVSAITTIWWAKYMLVFGFLILASFIFYEVRVDYPVLNLELFKNLAFAYSNLAAFTNYVATFAVGFLVAIYLQVIRGYDSQITGVILLSQPVVMALLSPLTGKLSDRIEPRILASGGIGLSTVALFGLAFLTSNTPLWILLTDLVLLGIGVALFTSPNINTVMRVVENDLLGVATSSLHTMRFIGQAMSLTLVAFIIVLYTGNVELSAAYSNLLIKGIKISFMVCTAFGLVGMFFSFARGNINVKQKQANQRS